MTRLVFTLLTLGPFGLVEERTAEELEWLRAHSFPLTTVAAGSGFEDLAPLAEPMADATIVGLGEGTHGTREFFQLKHRLVEYLAREHGYELFAMEANLPAAERVTPYVLDGEGDPRELVAGLGFWTWNNESVLALVEDMRRWNEDGDAYMQFTGVDVQSAEGASEWVVDFVAEHDPAYAKELGTTIWELTSDGVFSARPDPKVTAARADELLEEFETRLESWREDADEELLARAHHGMAFLAQCMHQRARNPKRPRDLCMAENVAWLLERHPDARIAVWAHNFHVARDPGWMGEYLMEDFEGEQFVIGLTTGQGTYRAAGSGGLQEFPLQEAPAGSFEHAVAQLGHPIVAVDLREVSAEDPASRWLTEPVLFRAVGSTETAEQFTPRRLAREFDLIVWIDRTTAARPLESGS